MSIRVLAALLIVSASCGTTESRPAGDPRPGDALSSGDPALGDPAPGDPAPGDPAPGDPAPGDPAPGDPAPGDPAPGDPAVGSGDPGVAGDAGLLTPCGIVFPPIVVLEATVSELHAAIGANEFLAVVDVREPGETASGIIEDALLFPWGGGVGGYLQSHHESLPDDRPLYIVCASGSRSRIAANWLVDNGHTCVHTVLGGMGAWNTAGYPTVLP